MGEYVEKMGSRAKEAVLLETAFGQNAKHTSCQVRPPPPHIFIGFRMRLRGANE